ncbi:MAG: hypothetical protein Q9186_002860 [Xanthomendoza sp. 1 TL-2023]
MRNSQRKKGVATASHQQPPNNNTADAERNGLAGERKGRKRAARLKKRERDPSNPRFQQLQAGRWLNNEQRKEDKGGITRQGFRDLFAWAKTMNREEQPMTADAEEAKCRYLKELEAATEEQGGRRGGRDWWTIAPSWSERTGEPRDKTWDKILKEEGRAAAEARAMGVANGVENMESGKHLVKLGVDIEGDGTGGRCTSDSGVMGAGRSFGRACGEMTPEPVLHRALEGSDSDGESEGGVMCADRDMNPEPVRCASLS